MALASGVPFVLERAAVVKRLWGNLMVLAHLRGQKRAPFLPRARIEALRDARVRRIVAHAAGTVPHYRELFAREGIDPREIRGAADLTRLPLLDSPTRPRRPRPVPVALARARRAGPDRAACAGQPLELHHDQRSLLANIAYGERERAPVIALCGGSFRPRELHIGYETSNFRQGARASTPAPRGCRQPRRDVARDAAPFEEIVAAINRVRPDLLTAYGGFLDMFFRTVVARGARSTRPRW